MNKRIVANVIFKNGVQAKFKANSVELNDTNMKAAEAEIDKLRDMIGEAYRESHGMYLSVGTAVINVSDTVSIDLAFVLAID